MKAQGDRKGKLRFLEKGNRHAFSAAAAEAKPRAKEAAPVAVGAECGASATAVAAERFAVDEDAATPTGECEYGLGHRDVGKSAEADAQTTARGGCAAAQKDPKGAAAQVGE